MLNIVDHGHPPPYLRTFLYNQTNLTIYYLEILYCSSDLMKAGEMMAAGDCGQAAVQKGNNMNPR
jgi:hypothetical protein